MNTATTAPAYLTPPTYAKRLGVKPAKIIAYIRAGELRAIDVSVHPGVGNPRYRITPEAVAEFEASRSSAPATPPPPPRATRRRAGRSYIR